LIYQCFEIGILLAYIPSVLKYKDIRGRGSWIIYLVKP
jgi:hypothetical protein